MKTKLHISIFLTLVFVCSISAQNVAYIYGDVSAHGKIPSGDELPFHQMRLNDESSLGLSSFRQAIEETGLKIKEYYDAETTLDKNFLCEIDVLILGSNQKTFSKAEANAVKKWVEKGGGLIAWSDSAFGGHYKHVGIANTPGRNSDNLIMEQFGMYFLTDNGGGNYLIKNYTENHFINNNNKNGGVTFRGEGVSFVRVSAPAKVLALADDGGLGGELKVNKIDDTFNLNTDAALAITEIKKGRVLGLFDRNMLWNDGGPGTQLSHSDNREFAQRILLWAAGIEDNNRVSKRKRYKNTGVNNPPTFNIEHEFTKKESVVNFVATIEDKDTDNVFPEITWKMLRGPKKVIFENNNPNTKTPTITLPAIGKYIIMAIITDGEFILKERIELTRNK